MTPNSYKINSVVMGSFAVGFGCLTGLEELSYNNEFFFAPSGSKPHAVLTPLQYR